MVLVSAGVIALSLVGCESGETGATDSFFTESGLPANAVVITDPKGDVRDVDGNEPPKESNAVDIVRAGIHLSDTELTLAVEHAAPVPSALGEIDLADGVGEWLSYMFFIADQQGAITYIPQIGLAGSKWTAHAYDKGTGDTVELERGPDILGAILVYAFPRASSVPDLQPPFKWGVGVTWERATSHDLSERLAFGDQATQNGKDGWSGYPYEWADYPQ
ncbi:MAG: hypothetical protein JXA87_06855 [Thermoleophilia bacterium]|nr:hypothetical protein [Thermoleophilia bacterium]